MGALGMIIAGIVILEGGNPTSAGRTVLRIGAALLLVDWAALFVWVIASLQSEEIKRLFVPLRGGPLGMLVQSFVSAKGHSQNDTGAQMYADGSKVSQRVFLRRENANGSRSYSMQCYFPLFSSPYASHIRSAT